MAATFPMTSNDLKRNFLPRDRQMERKRISVLLDPPTEERLQRLGQRTQRTLSAQIRYMLLEYLSIEEEKCGIQYLKE